MKEDGGIFDFSRAKRSVIDCLKNIQINLLKCVDEGMIDLEDDYYNEVLGFIDQASVSKVWAELEEVISKAKILETDVAAFLASHGKTSLSLPWPSVPKGK